LEVNLLSKETGRKVAHSVLRHVATNWYTYLQLIAALAIKDYAHAYIIVKKLCLKTALQFLFAKAKAIKENLDAKK
jgi:hypothetical protein